MSDKPSYLGLLNAIAVGEGLAHEYLRAWVEVTEDTDVRQALTTVAIREGEHALAFEKRLCELGFSLRKPADNERGEKLLALVQSDKSDLEKFEALGLGKARGDAQDPFGKMLADESIDPQTGALLGRYIAEERDSGRVLRACYEQLEAREHASADAQAAECSAMAESLRELRTGASDVASAIDDLQSQVATLRG